ncbi:MAG: DUF2188 domain-containing protein [Candidatus Hodarchaeota archaeon]
MAKGITYHVTKSPESGWNVIKEGAKRASAILGTKQQAVSRGKELVKGAPLGQIVIHIQAGKIQTEHTYGQDSYPPEG